MPYARTAIHTALRALRAGGLVLAVCVLGVTPGLRGDEVFFTDNPTNGAYDDIVHSLRDVYGNGTATAGNRNSPSGRWTEQNYGLYQITGTGNQSITMAFLYDDGDYEFEFGYFLVTETLQNLPSNTVAEKQAWAVEALSNAQVVFVDKDSTYTPPAGSIRVTADGNDVYTGTANDDNRQHDTGGGDDYDLATSRVTVTLQGGAYYGFFIIPDNRLSTFLNDWNDNGVFNTFSLNGSGASAWPLFTLNQGNPGNSANGSGAGLDQVFTFNGTTRSTTADALSASSNPNFQPDPNSPGALLTFEDIWRGPGSGSDNDFNDLHFYVDNSSTVGIVIPEPSTYAAGGLLAALLAWHAWRRRRKPSVPPPAAA